MLVIKRRDGESFVLEGSGESLRSVTVKQLSGGRIGIEAPKDVRIIRSELINRDDPSRGMTDPRRN